MAARTLADHGAGVVALYRRTSTRERLLLGGLALLALVLAPIKAYDWSQDRLAAVLDDKATLQQLQQTRDPNRVRRALNDLAARRREVDAWCWSSPSFPVARTQLEEVVAAAAVRGGMIGPDVKSADAPVVAGGVAFVRVELAGAFTWSVLDATIRELARSGKGFVVDTAAVEDESAGARTNIIVAPAKFRLVVLLPVRIGRGLARA